MAKTIPPVGACSYFPLPVATLYTDGSCWPNPGPGGWGCVVERQYYPNMEISGPSRFTTISRMELQAVINGLRALTGHYKVTVYSDSQYVVEGITTHIHRWAVNGWKNADGEQVKNYDLWAELFHVTSAHIITWVWQERNSLPKMEQAHQLASRARLDLVASLPVIPVEETRVTPLPPPLPVVSGSVHVSTAASCSGNPGPGAWAAVLNFNGHTKEVVGQDPATTSNRMQLMAAIGALEAMKSASPIAIYSNSAYVIEGVTRPIYRAMPNYDLWQRLMTLVEKFKPTWTHDAGPDTALAKKLTRKVT